MSANATTPSTELGMTSAQAMARDSLAPRPPLGRSFKTPLWHRVAEQIIRLLAFSAIQVGASSRTCEERISDR